MRPFHAGAPYLVKMKIDYVEIINGLQKKRENRNNTEKSRLMSAQIDVERLS
jgi:hypothetical protein